MKHLLAIAIALLPSAVLAQQFTPEQMLDVMTKSLSNRNVRVHDYYTLICVGQASLINVDAGTGNLFPSVCKNGSPLPAN